MPGISWRSGVLRFLVWAILAALKPKALLVSENLCLRQQLLVLQRRHPQPRLRSADRQFWICASRWFTGWRNSLLIVKPETVLRRHRRGWRAYWSWRSNRQHRRSGRRPIPRELQALIGRMTAENRLWGQRRIQAELARLGFRVSARTVAKYMSAGHYREPSPAWREFLKRHESNIWACDFLSPRCVSFDLEGSTARSPRSLSWVDCITSIGVPHDGQHFCALQPSGGKGDSRVPPPPSELFIVIRRERKAA
jgi:hypothetical protein